LDFVNGRGIGRDLVAEWNHPCDDLLWSTGAKYVYFLAGCGRYLFDNFGGDRKCLDNLCNRRYCFDRDRRRFGYSARNGSRGSGVWSLFRRQIVPSIGHDELGSCHGRDGPVYAYQVYDTNDRTDVGDNLDRFFHYRRKSRCTWVSEYQWYLDFD